MTNDRQQLGKYQILAELGRGGFATVYRAVDTTLEREVALKILHPQLLADSAFVQRFRQEARTLAALRHPQIITVYEVGEAEGRLFIAMDLAHGPSLAQSIARRRRIPWSEALELLKTICTALDYAHSQRVVHRDLKPANVLLDKQRGVLLTDFGFARLMGESSVSLSMSGGVAGTPGYIAPEVWEQNVAEAPADIYALSCIAYEMLTGEVLFRGQTPMQVMRAHDRGPAFPEAWQDDVPPGIAAVLGKALAHDPADRYSSAMALWYALNDLEAAARAAREAQAQTALIGQWRAEAEAALATGELSAARMAIGRWKAIAPEDADAKAAQARLEQRVMLAPQAAAASPPKAEPASRSVPAQAPKLSVPALSPVAAPVSKPSSKRTGPSSRTLIVGSSVATLILIGIVALISLVLGAGTPIGPIQTAITFPTAQPAATAPAPTSAPAAARPQPTAVAPQQGSAITCSAIAGMPVFAGATCTDQGSHVDDGVTKLENTYTTSASAADVRRFYESAFAEQGWSTDEFTYTVDLGRRRLTIDVQTGQGASGTSTKVRLSEDGSLATAGTPCPTIDGLPAFPNATCIKVDVDQEAGIVYTKITYSTNASPEAVRRFYESTLSQNGWASQDAQYGLRQGVRRLLIDIRTQQRAQGSFTEFKLAEK